MWQKVRDIRVTVSSSSSSFRCIGSADDVLIWPFCHDVKTSMCIRHSIFVSVVVVHSFRVMTINRMESTQMLHFSHTLQTKLWNERYLHIYVCRWRRRYTTEMYYYYYYHLCNKSIWPLLANAHAHTHLPAAAVTYARTLCVCVNFYKFERSSIEEEEEEEEGEARKKTTGNVLSQWHAIIFYLKRRKAKRWENAERSQKSINKTNRNMHWTNRGV